MLENSLWLRYNPDKTIREVLARIYEMNEAGLSPEEIGAEVGLKGEELKKAQYKAYRKIRQDKIRFEVRADKVKEERVEEEE
ncbi:MAG: hypothetical protein IE884_04525 [Sulfuricurvum sp.]|nr:hypothetical protein [Sulfuricurvum sp.]